MSKELIVNYSREGDISYCEVSKGKLSVVMRKAGVLVSIKTEGRGNVRQLKEVLREVSRHFV